MQARQLTANKIRVRELTGLLQFPLLWHFFIYFFGGVKWERKMQLKELHSTRRETYFCPNYWAVLVLHVTYRRKCSVILLSGWLCVFFFLSWLGKLWTIATSSHHTSKLCVVIRVNSLPGVLAPKCPDSKQCLLFHLCVLLCFILILLFLEQRLLCMQTQPLYLQFLWPLQNSKVNTSSLHLFLHV